MFRRILVAIDLTSQSSGALRVAGGLGQLTGGRISVAHVVEMPGVLKRWGNPVYRDDLKTYDQLLSRQVSAAERALDRMVSAAGLTSMRGVRCLVRTGAPAPTLATLVEDLDADLVIVARGRGGKLGPVAEQLVRLVGRTVMVAPVRGPRAASIEVAGPRRPGRAKSRAAA